MRIQVRQSVIVFSIVVVSIVVAGFIIVFVPSEPPPSWFVVEPKFSSDDNIILNISEQDLSNYPQVLSMINSIEMMRQPNPATGTVTSWTPPWKKMNHEEAITLMAIMGGEYKSRIDFYSHVFRMNDKLYSLYMYFSSSPPITL
jgi:hypothetical protein